MKTRLDKELLNRKMVQSRSQAENFIKLGLVRLNDRKIIKTGYMVSEKDVLQIEGEQYVSRAALKLASVAGKFRLKFQDKTVLDVGSSTGGFTDYALKHGAKSVIAVDVGTEQLHPSLRVNGKVELHEKTDIRDFVRDNAQELMSRVDMIVADVSFISLTKILPCLHNVTGPRTEFVMMCKPQFEAQKSQVNKGVIKNSSIRRKILKNFETWLRENQFVIADKSDSQVSGTKGNVERFYLLQSVKK